MKQRIKALMAGGAAIALLLSAQPVAAQCCPQPDPCCNPCTDWCDMCGDWEFGAHALYYTPVFCPFTYAINVPAQVQGQRAVASASAVKCSADWGFRVFGRYRSNCSFLGLSYQWYQSTAASSRSGLLIRIPDDPIVGFFGPQNVQARQRLEYQNLDLRWGKYLHRTCACNFYLFGNVRWVDVSAKQSLAARRVDAQQAVQTEEVTQKGTLEGGAIGVGAGGEFDVWCNFGIFGEANLLGVVGERKTTSDGSIVTAGVFNAGGDVSWPSDTCIIPEVYARLGIDYRWCCDCWTFVGEIGYEIDYFWSGLAMPNTPRAVAQESTTAWLLNCQNIGFSGLFFGGKVLF